MDFISEKKSWLLVCAAAVLILLTYTFWKRTPPGIYWGKNTGQMYTVSYNETSTYKVNKQSRPSYRIRLNGTLNCRVLEQSKTVKIMFQFSDLSLFQDGMSYTELDRLYSSPFIAEFAKNGAIKDFYFPADIASVDAQNISSAIREMQFVIKKSITSAWQTKEYDSDGTYEAEYIYDKTFLKKAKTGYLEILDSDGYANKDITAAVRESRVDILYGKPVTWLRKASGKSKVSFFSGDGTYSTSFVKFTIRKIKFKPQKNLAIWNEKRPFSDIMTEWSSRQKNKLSFAETLKIRELKKTYGTVSFNAVVLGILAGPSDPDAEQKLAGYLSLYPGESARLGGLIAGSGLGTMQRSIALHALARAGHAEAQKTLVGIMNDNRCAEKTRILSAAAIQYLSIPLPLTIEGLWNAYHEINKKNHARREVADSAVLTLGILSRNMSRSYREDQKNIAEEIREKIESELSGEPAGKIALIEAAGNTGHRDVLDAIEDELDSDKTQERSAAVSALTHIDDPDVSGILFKRLETEPSPVIKIDIVRVLAERDPDEESALKMISLVSAEKNAGVREKMYLFILKNRDSARVWKNLPELLKTETSPSNRKILSSAIHRAGSRHQ